MSNLTTYHNRGGSAGSGRKFFFEIVQIGRAQMLEKNIYKNQESEILRRVVTTHFSWN